MDIDRPGSGCFSGGFVPLAFADSIALRQE